MQFVRPQYSVLRPGRAVSCVGQDRAGRLAFPFYWLLFRSNQANQTDNRASPPRTRVPAWPASAAAGPRHDQRNSYKGSTTEAQRHRENTEKCI